MQGLNREFTKQAIARLETLPADKQPNWGTLTAPELVPHLIGVIKHSMGQLPPLKFTGNWFTTTILPRIVYTGLLLPPKNLKVKSEVGEEVPAVTWPGDLDTLGQTMEEFIGGVESGALKGKTAVHPLFGDIGPEGWAKVHVVHFRHHFKQFGI